MPLSFLVKHNAARRKPLANCLATYSHQPVSYTSLEWAAKLAAEGNHVYVVETRLAHGVTTYWLGYRFTSTQYDKPDDGGLWEDEFKWRNRSDPPTPGEGLYLDTPALITDSALTDWLRTARGMPQIPDALVPRFIKVLAKAKPCA